MSTLQEMRYKETSPDKTVKRIKEILKNSGVEVEENWAKKSCVGTYSLRLCVKGTNIGQNGKGMTKEFAMASAYAEFLERYQNGVLVFRQEKPNKELPFVYSADEKNLTIQELVAQNDSFINQVFYDNRIGETTELEVLTEILGNENSVTCLPHYSIKDKKVVYIPHVLSCHLYGSNGMCAGNSIEEAMIEGISEILERYVSMQLIYKRVTFPEIPDSYLEDYPKVKSLLEKARKKEGYICKLLDCSFGGKYPVAALIVIQKNTGKFGIKLGAHPDYGIAMERCFTEATQGRDLYEYATGCVFDFKNDNLEKNGNIKEFVNSNVATIPYNIFSNEKSFPFTKISDVSGLNNKEILKRLVTSILEDGYDVIVRDVSSLGFPSLRIIIPGMTEVTHAPMASRFQMFEELEYLLKDLNRITFSNLNKVINIMETQINEVGFTSLYTFMNIKDASILPCEDFGNGAKYFLGICYIMQGNYEKAEKIFKEILLFADNCEVNPVTHILLKAVYYYASGMNKIGEHNEVMKYINTLFDNEIAQAIHNSFKDREKVLIHHYDVNQEDYVENDDSYYLPFMDILRKAQKTNIINQENLKTVFEGYEVKRLVEV